MSEKEIEPALSVEAWASVQRGDGLPYALGSSLLDELGVLEGRDIPAAIAYLNHQLPDDDPRKITRRMVDDLRAAVNVADANSVGGWDDVLLMVNALESYLPPETGT